MPNLLITADAVGGVWNYSIALVRELSRRGYASTLAVLGPPPNAAQKWEAGTIPGVRVIEIPSRLEWMENPWADVDAAGQVLLGLCRELQPDIVHLNGYSYGDLSWPCPKLVVAHSCVASWWEAVYHEPLPAVWGNYVNRVRRGLDGADAVVAPTQAMGRAIASHYRIKRSVHVIPNGLESSEYVSATKEPLIFAAGRVWDEAKNLSLLAGIADELEWPVYVAGDSMHPEKGRRRLENLTCLGVLNSAQMRHWYSRAAIFCAPARYEPFGLSILEAGLSGCALILGDIPSLREVWEDCAVYVNPMDACALRSKLSELMDVPELTTELGGKARSRGLHYSACKMADEYCNVYTSLAGSGMNLRMAAC